MKILSVALFSVVFFNAYASLTISTFNIRNFDKKKKLGTDKVLLKQMIKDLQTDVLAVEEIYNDSSFYKFVERELPEFTVVLSRCGGGGKQKVGFLYRADKIELIKTHEDSRISDPGYVVSQYGCGSLRPAFLGFFKEKKSNRKFVAIALHLKAGGGTKNYQKRAKQYKLLTKMVRELRLAGHNNIILLGDMNTTGFDLRDSDYRNFNTLLSQTGLSTVSTEIKCTSYWPGQDYHDDIEEPSTLDHIVYSGQFLGYKSHKTDIKGHCKVAQCAEVYNSTLGTSYSDVSDHCPLRVQFK